MQLAAASNTEVRGMTLGVDTGPFAAINEQVLQTVRVV